MKSLIELAKEYRMANKKDWAFYVQIPYTYLLLFFILILFSWIEIKIPGLLHIKTATILAIGLLIYYAFLDWRIALAILPILFIFTCLAIMVADQGINSRGGFVVLFVAVLCVALSAIIFYSDKNHQSFYAPFNDLFLFISLPLIVTMELFFLFGYLTHLEEAIKKP